MRPILNESKGTQKSDEVSRKDKHLNYGLGASSRLKLVLIESCL